MAREQGSPEDRLIARYFKPLAKHPGAFGLADDAAAITPPAGHDLVLTTDAIVASVHFLPDDPADTVAKKALRVNLSDLAAKGAQPAGFLLTLALPDFSEQWLAAFARGLAEDADQFDCALLGGDTVRTPGPATISVTALGTVPRGTMVGRSGAKAGDHVLVTGTIGDAALGLQLLREPRLADAWNLDSALQDALVARYHVPQPRNRAAEAIRKHASAAMDVSDGLVGDLRKLCAVSGVSAEITVWDIPFSPAAERALKKDSSLGEAMLTGGDDYEVLCTIPAADLDAFRAAALQAGVSVTSIGKTVAGDNPPRLVDREGKTLFFRSPAYSHF